MSLDRELKLLVQKDELKNDDLCDGLNFIYQSFYGWYKDINKHFPLESDEKIEKLGKYMYAGVHKQAAESSEKLLENILTGKTKVNLNEKYIGLIEGLKLDVHEFLVAAVVKMDWYRMYRNPPKSSAEDMVLWKQYLTGEIERWKLNVMSFRDRIGNRIIQLESDLKCNQNRPE